MCCRPCEGERRAGDNRKIRRAATYIVSFGMRNTRARGFIVQTRASHSKPCHSQEMVRHHYFLAPFAHVVRLRPSAETRAQRRLQWQARRIRCPSC